VFFSEDKNDELDDAISLTDQPGLEPSSASTDGYNDLDRRDPAPIMIEASISSLPGCQSST